MLDVGAAGRMVVWARNSFREAMFRVVMRGDWLKGDSPARGRWETIGGAKGDRHIFRRQAYPKRNVNRGEK